MTLKHPEFSPESHAVRVNIPLRQTMVHLARALNPTKQESLGWGENGQKGNDIKVLHCFFSFVEAAPSL